jgi:hypothetical protein
MIEKNENFDVPIHSTCSVSVTRQNISPVFDGMRRHIIIRKHR